MCEDNVYSAVKGEPFAAWADAIFAELVELDEYQLVACNDVVVCGWGQVVPAFRSFLAEDIHQEASDLLVLQPAHYAYDVKGHAPTHEGFAQG